MNDRVYDLTISEAAKLLDKSDRQVRRYVKERRISAKPMRIDGHVKLLFCRDEILAFKEGAPSEVPVTDADDDMVVDAQLVMDMGDAEPRNIDATLVGSDSPDTEAVKYAIDALTQQIRELRQENSDLNSQLAKVSGLVGFWQAKAEVLQEEVKMLAPVPKPEPPPRRGFWAWFTGKE